MIDKMGALRNKITKARQIADGVRLRERRLNCVSIIRFLYSRSGYRYRAKRTTRTTRVFVRINRNFWNPAREPRSCCHTRSVRTRETRCYFTCRAKRRYEHSVGARFSRKLIRRLFFEITGRFRRHRNG